MSSRFKLLICDLDNTLYDWVSYFVPAFYAMADKAVQLTGIDRERLLDDFRVVHQRHKDSEHPFSLIEALSVQEKFKGLSPSQMAEILDPAFHAFNSTRKNRLKLHDGVVEALATISNSGIKIVAHTESKLYGAIDRLTRLDIDKYFSKVYCRERASVVHPKNGTSDSWLEKISKDKIVELSHHQMKPDPDVLREICSNEKCAISEVAYVGDSIARDILMAKKVGVFAIWAAYGAQHNQALYEGLVRISHWTSEDVQKEIDLKKEAAVIKPDFIATNSFREILAPLGLVAALN
jgi:phosphoglycolate phosphatase